MKIIALATLLFAPGAPEERFPADLEALRWMAGCWATESGDLVVEEQWMAPRGGSMIGMSRTIRADSTVGYELMQIVARDGQLLLIVDPSGQVRSSFAARDATDALVVFENPEHAFPQRILYRRVGADSLFARVEGLRSGQTRGIDFPYHRTDCP